MGVIQKIKNRIVGYPEPKSVGVGDVAIGKLAPIFFVAEIGINHNGSLRVAKRLIDVAHEAGCSAVKFQKRTVPAVYSEEELNKPHDVARGVLESAVKRGVLSKDSVERLKKSDFKKSTIGDLKWALEFTTDEYREIDSYCKEKGIIWFASPWDLESVDFLEKFGVPVYKVGSAALSNHDLLRKVRETGKPVILSTGMSATDQIRKAVSLLDQKNLVLMHAVSTYPAELKDINLKAINSLRWEFQNSIPVGYSGHEKGIGLSIAAAGVGARAIERHITLDRGMFGQDQEASLEPHEMKALVSEVRLMEEAWGDGAKRSVRNI